MSLGGKFDHEVGNLKDEQLLTITIGSCTQGKQCTFNECSSATVGTPSVGVMSADTANRTLMM